MSIIKKEIKDTCCICKGKGCDKCINGQKTENHYYIIDEKNKIAFDGDTLK